MRGNTLRSQLRREEEREALKKILLENPDYKVSLYRRKYCPLHFDQETCPCLEEHKQRMKKERYERKMLKHTAKKLRNGKSKNRKKPIENPPLNTNKILKQGNEAGGKEKFEKRQLNPWAFRMITCLLGPITTDLFASSKSAMAHVKEYYFAPDCKERWTAKGRPDAFKASWSVVEGRKLYMNPVYSDKKKILEKLKADEAVAIIVAPHYWSKDLDSHTLVRFSLPKAVDIFLPKGKTPTFCPTVFFVDYRNERAGQLKRLPFFHNDLFLRWNPLLS
eukprot:Nk52_evm10s1916 gene=Nk52_evmTU10s1916